MGFPCICCIHKAFKRFLASAVMGAPKAGAREEAVPRQNGCVSKHPSRRNGYESQKTGSAGSIAILCRLFKRISHAGVVEASPEIADGFAAVALEDPTAGFGLAVYDLELWRFAARAFLDRQGVLFGVFV